jgi:L-lactate utilization protein LutC
VTETGDRSAFLSRARARLAGGVPANPAHPMPPQPDEVPTVRSRRVDVADLVGSFERNATAVEAVVHHGLDTVAEIVDKHGVRRAVVTEEPEAQEVGELLAGLGVAVGPVTIEDAAAADLGVTGAVYGVAVTGSVVMSSTDAGSRVASLLPPVHLCVLREERLVPSPAEVLRPMGDPPANLVFVTGPSRSGDIEQILTLGVHGPVAVHVVIVSRPG